MIKVVNLRNYVNEEGWVLVKVDRSSVLGNVFKMKNESSNERGRVCDEYEKYFNKKVSENGEFRDEVMRICKLVKNGENVALGCWCFPKRCHAFTIKRFVESYCKSEESKGSSPVFERLSKGGFVDTLTYTFQTYANDGHKLVHVKAVECVDNSDCNAPNEFYTKSERYMTREKAREFYKECLNAGFKKPWYDKIDWSEKASK